RREFITLVGGAAVAWPLAARAQQPSKPPTIGVLAPGTPSSHRQWVAALVHRLRELGWIDGRTIAIEYRWAEGSSERAARIAPEFVGLKVDVIVTSATAPTFAAKQATSAIPIVFAAAGDPVGSGLVASLARPGGNLTGLSLQFTDLAGKRIELLREVVPDLRRLGLFANVSSRSAVLETGTVQSMGGALGLEVITPVVRRPEDIAPAFELFKDRVEALYVVTDPLVNVHQVRINALALATRLGTMQGFRESVEAGGLMSYGPNNPDLYRSAAEFAYTYLVPADSTIRSAADADRPGIRVAVVNKHASTLTLSRVIKHAELTGADVPDAAFELLRTGKADAFASAREPLEDYAAKLPGSRVLTDAYGVNRVGIAIQQGHPARLTYISEFVAEAKASGLVQGAIDRAGLSQFRVAPSARTN